MKKTITDKNGRSYAIRPFNKTDDANLIELFSQMSAESRYRRFHQPVTELEQELVQTYAAEIVAQTVEQGDGLIVFEDSRAIGAARLVKVRDGTAEIAMSIADAYQNVGLGKKLLTQLCQTAAQNGWRQLVATIQNDNEAIWHVLKSLPYLLLRQIDRGESNILIHLTVLTERLHQPFTYFSNFPLELFDQIEGATWFLSMGHSGSAVFRLEAAGSQTRYLKIVTAEQTAELVAERERLEWLNGRLPVPTVLAFHQDRHHGFLLMSAIDGTPASRLSNHPQEAKIIKRLAEGLRLIHAIPVDDVPFVRRLETLLPEAEARMKAGLVDEEDFDEERLGMKTADLYAELLEKRPFEDDLVFTHGDYCLPNVLVDIETVRGFIDWGRAGVADRYQDLALVARSLNHNFGPASIEPFFAAYGLPDPDKEKLAYYQLIDEFF